MNQSPTVVRGLALMDTPGGLIFRGKSWVYQRVLNEQVYQANDAYTLLLSGGESGQAYLVLELSLWGATPVADGG